MTIPPCKHDLEIGRNTRPHGKHNEKEEGKQCQEKNVIALAMLESTVEPLHPSS